MKKVSRKDYLKAFLTVAVCIAVFIVIYAVNEDFFGKNQLNKKNIADQTFVRFIDVGQGDSILVYSKGHCALIDTGVSSAWNSVYNEFKNIGTERIDALVVTHLDSDHSGGLAKICDNFAVSNLILPELSVESEGITAAEYAINSVTSSAGQTYTAKPGMNFDIGDFEITVLAQFSNMPDENNRSTVMMVKAGDIKFLLTGDIEAKSERLLLGENLNLNCDVLKVAHHGSAGSSSEDFLKAASPKFAVISVGSDNVYGHPHNKTLANLEYYGAKLYRTDLNGNITFYINDGKLSPYTER